jgi:Rps23 Pro-64 3,4-dihydroxylase Tpa1-like proline 4-hydroxylase
MCDLKTPCYVSPNNNVQIYKNALSNFILEDCVDYANYCIKKDIYTTTNQISWDKEIAGKSNVIKVIKLDDENKTLKKKICYDLENKLNFFTDGLKLNLHIMQEGCYVNDHYDNHVDYAFTIYLNKTWQKEYGGIFQFDIENNIYNIVPEYNTMVILKNNLHRVTKQTSKNLRISLQGFFAHKFFYNETPIELLCNK